MQNSHLTRDILRLSRWSLICTFLPKQTIFRWQTKFFRTTRNIKSKDLGHHGITRCKVKHRGGDSRESFKKYIFSNMKLELSICHIKYTSYYNDKKLNHFA